MNKNDSNHLVALIEDLIDLYSKAERNKHNRLELLIEPSLETGKITADFLGEVDSTYRSAAKSSERVTESAIKAFLVGLELEPLSKNPVEAATARRLLTAGAESVKVVEATDRFVAELRERFPGNQAILNLSVDLEVRAESTLENINSIRRALATLLELETEELRRKIRSSGSRNPLSIRKLINNHLKHHPDYLF